MAIIRRTDAPGSQFSALRSDALDGAKFSTQRCVTYIVLTIFASVVVNVMLGTDQSERSMILQTVINITLLALGFWLGSSKQGQEQAQSVSRMAEAAPAVAAAVVANAVPAPQSPIQAGTVNVEADTANVTTGETK